MYIELDHDLVPGKISDIKIEINLPTGKEQEKKEEKSHWFRKDSMLVKKYKIQHGDINQAIRLQNAQRILAAKESREDYQKMYPNQPETPEDELKDLSGYEAVAGTNSGPFYCDQY